MVCLRFDGMGHLKRSELFRPSWKIHQARVSERTHTWPGSDSKNGKQSRQGECLLCEHRDLIMSDVSRLGTLRDFQGLSKSPPLPGAWRWDAPIFKIVLGLVKHWLNGAPMSPQIGPNEGMDHILSETSPSLFKLTVPGWVLQTHSREEAVYQATCLQMTASSIECLQLNSKEIHF